MTISMFTGFAVFAVVIVITLAVIIIVASFLRKPDSKLDIGRLFKVYAFLMRFISLIGLAIGIALLFKPIFAYTFGYQFSYRLEPYFEQSITEDELKQPLPASNPNSDTIEIANEKYFTSLRERQQDLLNGATLTTFMAIIYIIHYFVSRKLDSSKEISMERKAYLFTGLVFFSIVSVVGIPTAIYQVINYLTSDLATQVQSYNQVYPGEALAVAIVTLPLWIAFILQLFSVYRKEQK